MFEKKQKADGTNFFLVREEVYIENLQTNLASVLSAPVADTDVANKLYVDDIAFDVLNVVPFNVATNTSVVTVAWASNQYNLKGRINTATGAISVQDGESVEFSVDLLLDNPVAALNTAASLLKVQLTSLNGTTTIFATRDVAAGDAAGPCSQTGVTRTFGYTNTSGATETMYLTVRGETLGVTLVVNTLELTARWLKQ
ncbi:MAG: hypothetical protein KIT69_01815 [Propionibacteriaceae bacterium]|nr:hypothetical protein [Propionibacteriaceae bacterium]